MRLIPIDLTVTFRDSSKQTVNIPLAIMFNAKTAIDDDIDWEYRTDSGWYWTHPTYAVKIDRPLSEIIAIEIDPSMRLADIDRSDNRIEPSESTESILNN